MKLYKSIIMAAAPALLLGACSENSWNDHLDGFTVPPVAGGETKAEYALHTDDYATIASLPANIALAEKDGESEALAAIAANGAFATEEQATKYLPALLASTNKNLPYYTYNDGSAVKLTYNVTADLPEQVKQINAGTLTYTVSEAEYQQVWGSDDDYINAFAPAYPAAASLPMILKQNLQAEAGQYAVVTYNRAEVNPIFGTPDQGEETYNEIGSIAEGQNVKIKGVITALQARGFVVSDATGSLLCYQASGFDATAVALYSEVIVSGTVATYNKGYQLAVSASDYEITGIGEYTYPAPTVVTGADMDAAILQDGPFLAQYVQLTGTMSVSGNYYNFNVDGATSATGSCYMLTDAVKAQLEDGKTYTLTGYFTSISGGRYYNMVILDVAAPGSKVRRPAVRRAPLAEVSYEVENALYQFDGTAWKAVSDVVVLNPADYTAMGLSYANLTGSQPDEYLPVFLKNRFPYAAVEDTKTVAYTYYNSGASSIQAREYVLGADGKWGYNAGQVTSQFVKMDGEWKYNPSVVITLPYVRNTDPSYAYYMACVVWVYENICVPMGDTSMTSGEYFIDYRANAEFYSGASAYYGNVDVRAASALNNMPVGYTGYEGLSNDQITELMKKRFCTEVMPGALKAMHPEARAILGMDVTYTINFTGYDGAASEESVVYLVTGDAEFTFQSTTWVSEEAQAEWKK